jgi:hypothetical protein
LRSAAGIPEPGEAVQRIGEELEAKKQDFHRRHPKEGPELE